MRFDEQPVRAIEQKQPAKREAVTLCQELLGGSKVNDIRLPEPLRKRRSIGSDSEDILCVSLASLGEEAVSAGRLQIEQHQAMRFQIAVQFGKARLPDISAGEANFELYAEQRVHVPPTEALQ